MKTGMLKLTSDEKGQGDLWIQCEKVAYVVEDYTGDGNRTLVGMTSGEVLRVKEATLWVRKAICPPHNN